jgi:hypothetical protein
MTVFVVPMLVDCDTCDGLSTGESPHLIQLRKSLSSREEFANFYLVMLTIV